MKFRVTVTPMDDEARKSMLGSEIDHIECNGYGLLAVRGNDEPTECWIHKASIDDLAKAMAGDGHYRAAARHAIAYYDGRRDIEQEKAHKCGLDSSLSMLR